MKKPNSKQNKSWSRWKSESAQNKNQLDQNKQPSQRRDVNQIVNHGLSGNSQNVKVHNNVQQVRNQQKSNSSMKYKLQRKLTSAKSAPTIYGYASSSKTTVPTKPPLAGSGSVTKAPFKMVVTPSSSGHSMKEQKSTILRKPKGNLRWKKNEKISPQIQDLKSTEGNKVESTTAKTLTKNPFSSSLISSKAVTSLPNTINKHSSSSHFNTSSKSNRSTVTVTLPKSGKPLTKDTSVPSSSSSDSKNPLTSDRRTVALPKASNSPTKTTSIPTTLTKNSPSSHSNTASSNSPLDRRVVHLPKKHQTTSKVLNTTNTGTAQSTTSLDRRIIHLPKSQITNSKALVNNTSKNGVQSTTSLDRRAVTLPKSLGTTSKVSSQITKSKVPNATVSKGAKLKWRRKSASQLRSDSLSKNPRSKSLFGNQLQSRIALKAKWRKADSTTLRRAVSSTGIRHSRTTVTPVPKRVFHSQHTKNILQPRTIPRRSRLKWSKSPSHSTLSTKSDQLVVRRSKAKFAHNSRFCLKRRKSSEGKVYRVNGHYLNSSHFRTGAINKVKPQNKGFVARLVLSSNCRTAVLVHDVLFRSLVRC